MKDSRFSVSWLWAMVKIRGAGGVKNRLFLPYLR